MLWYKWDTLCWILPLGCFTLKRWLFEHLKRILICEVSNQWCYRLKKKVFMYTSVLGCTNQLAVYRRSYIWFTYFFSWTFIWFQHLFFLCTSLCLVSILWFFHVPKVLEKLVFAYNFHSKLISMQVILYNENFGIFLNFFIL